MERSELAPAVPPIVGIARWIIGISLIVFAVQHFLYSSFVAGLIAPWMPFRLFWAWFVGVAFCAAALSFLSGKSVRLASFLLGLMFAIFVLIEHAPRIAAHLHGANEWTSGFIALAMAGCGWMLARLSSPGKFSPFSDFLRSGRFLFSLAVLAFGVQHLIFARSGGGIGPPWYPHGSFSAILVGLVLLAAGIAGLSGVQVRLGGLLLFAVLLLLFVLVQVPRMLPNLHDPRPWTTAFEILALCGAALLLAAS